MSLVDEYRRQLAWRRWSEILDALPPLEGRTVLDLGCGVGDLAAELAARGARVVGIDGNEELLAHARSRRIRGTEFRTGDLRALHELDAPVDGIWSSFAAAYIPDLPPALAAWARSLKPDGFIALTEIDDLFGHEPMGERTKGLLERYVDDALAAGRYDFRMGRKLGCHLESCGFAVLKTMTVPDSELSFDGPAAADVLDAWALRFERMGLLRDACGSEFEAVRTEFLGCLARADHVSTAKVRCCIARRAPPPEKAAS